MSVCKFMRLLGPVLVDPTVDCQKGEELSKRRRFVIRLPSQQQQSVGVGYRQCATRIACRLCRTAGNMLRTSQTTRFSDSTHIIVAGIALAAPPFKSPSVARDRRRRGSLWSMRLTSESLRAEGGWSLVSGIDQSLQYRGGSSSPSRAISCSTFGLFVPCHTTVRVLLSVVVVTYSGTCSVHFWTCLLDSDTHEAEKDRLGPLVADDTSVAWIVGGPVHIVAWLSVAVVGCRHIHVD
ncbi:hypothetical protein AG1IA_08494 [Rhizoctonia solani AG-1 IA]|uniref:Uncharacterized protein n=1 Tax=Thanatephorus cucumeris (strain AG1-IA) TaxID=983506 RepID=L8WH03_THACA|nr:hypothetical protein AG1IA_08494 [Rhizoctonia solani AG-1 IA]